MPDFGILLIKDKIGSFLKTSCLVFRDDMMEYCMFSKIVCTIDKPQIEKLIPLILK